MIVMGLQGQPHPPRAYAGDLRGAWECGWYHDSAAVLMIDGEVVAAIEEERLTRRKHTGKLPLRAMRACLEVAACAAGDVDLFAFGEQGGSGKHRDPTIAADALAAILQAGLGLMASPRTRVKLFEHHLCHALSAYALSGYDEALVFTADGFGDGVSGYVIEACGRRLEILDQIAVPDSLGGLYQAALPLLGFGAHDEFKMMGLAPYGNPVTYRQAYASAYRLEAEGRYQLNRGVLLRHLAELGPPRHPDDVFSTRDCDVAAAAQAALEEIAFHVLRHYRNATGLRALCAAGGVMQNCALNGRLARSGLFDRIFVQPAASDCGLALGAACLGQLQHGGENAHAITPQSHVFLGRPIPEEQALAVQLQRWEGLLSFRRCDDIVQTAAQLLAAGQVLGWVQGRSEFGPRALGNRSILADPRAAANKDRINAMVKKREAFRPFAPAVRSEDADRYFDLPQGTDCSFMTMVVPVRQEFQAALGAVTHVDGTARVQVVKRMHNTLFWQLLDAFGALTGTPVLLNTSFNNNHEPIVDTVDDAVACFLTTGLDALAIGPFLVNKAELSPQRLLALQPVLCDEGCLSTGWAQAADGARERFHVLLLANRQIPISAAAYQALNAERTGMQDCVPAGELAAELLSLWEQRVIHLRPAGLIPPSAP
ncbi:carbamoyltransferase family protein [Duganella sp. S19_KUP01_CR8]|uniref:carbamoyltransferase family protein n=1 Tax=Duganella sp. S19_KUP01_CR8 TaxID=3025502 RepID=UPI002FCDBC4F